MSLSRALFTFLNFVFRDSSSRTNAYFISEQVRSDASVSATSMVHCNRVAYRQLHGRHDICVGKSGFRTNG